MFLLPRRLKENDVINISGYLPEQPSKFGVNLILADYNNSPDYNNIACQLEANFTTDQFLTRKIKDGVSFTVDDNFNYNTADLFIRGGNFSFQFKIHGDDEKYMTVIVGDATVQFVMEHNIEDIKFISMYGDIQKIEKLEFEFA